MDEPMSERHWAEKSTPWCRVWECVGSAETTQLTLMPDLCVHLAFDLAGLIEVEPFLLNPNPDRLTIDVPPDSHLVGLSFLLWDAADIRQGSGAAAEGILLRSVSVDADWAFFLYFELLELRNRLSAEFNLDSVLTPFARYIAASLQGDSRKRSLMLDGLNGLDIGHKNGHGQSSSYSKRHRRRIYRDFIGLSPKQVQRIARFQRLLKSLEAGHEPEFSDYYDQAHAIKEFKRMTGMTPVEYQRYVSRR